MNDSKSTLDRPLWVSENVKFAPADEILPRRNPFGNMANAKDRLKPEAWPNITPTFTIPAGGTIFTVGSCFARNVERNLAKLGFEIPTLRIKLPPHEIAIWEGNLLNKYTAPGMYQEIAWAHAIYTRDDKPTEADSAKLGYVCDDGQIIDLHLHKYIPVPAARFFERRAEVYQIFREAFRADLVTLTFGMIESWFDRKENLFILAAPSVKEMRNDRERFTFTQLDYDTCLKYATETINLIRSVNPDCAFLITTSPVALQRTFTEMDVITANMESKSVLRAVCGEVSRRYDRLDYFPSYENATLTRSWDVYTHDLFHISDAFVAKIVQHLVDAYFSNASPFARAFQEAWAKNAEGKVDEAIELLQPVAENPLAHPESAVFLCELYIRSKRFDKAVTVLEILMVAQPDNATVWHHLSWAYMGLRRREEALIPAMKAVALNPHKFGFLRHLAGVQKTLSLWDEALSTLASASALIEKDGSTHLECGKILVQIGRTAEAEERLRTAMQLGDKHVETYGLLADILVTKGQVPEAEETLRLGLSLVADKDKPTLQAQLTKLESSHSNAPAV